MTLMNTRYKTLLDILDGRIERNRIFTDEFHTLAYGTDASFYRLIPEIVIYAKDEEEVSFILRTCSELIIPVTFRAAGTSLSGQAVTDSVLLVAGQDWKKWSLSADAGEITLQPGNTGGRANAILQPYGKKIGPDPASINAAMIGGIAANNASGMCCGTAENSYRTLAGMRMVFADGAILDTRDEQSREAFSKSHAFILKTVADLAARTKHNHRLSERIRHKYKIKNTTGYSLNALVDFSDPFHIIEHLMIGSEGTLGFISEITYKTVNNPPFQSACLLAFPDISTACASITVLKNLKVSAAELIDRKGIRSVEEQVGMPGYLGSLPGDACVVLTSIAAGSEDELRSKENLLAEAFTGIPTLYGIRFTTNQHDYEMLWKIRKGLFPSIGAMRETGTTVIIEDVAFPLDVLADATNDLRALLNRNGYGDAVIFGHALEGNLHFVFCQDFNSPRETARYSGLMEDIAELVTGRYDGSLKAEHGTGRNMAPFVEKEWGKEAYALMKEIKHIFDPFNILNPGVILNSDEKVHLKNLKPIPASSEITDKCTECGFCEASCVSAGLTLSPRQRIVIHRELMSLRQDGHKKHITASLQKQFDYDFDYTCATDGLCAMACPVNIDCGKLVKSFRNGRANSKIAGKIAGNMKSVTSLARFSLSAVNAVHSVVGTDAMSRLAAGMRAISGNRLPVWNKYMPSGAEKIRPGINDGSRSMKAVYFPSCINRSMGVSRDSKGDQQLSSVMISLMNKAGFDVIFPENMDSLCCGMAFTSKGYTQAGSQKSAELEAALIRASNNWEHPVVCDMSPCLFTMKENIKSPGLYEPAKFILKFLLPHLNVKKLDETVAVFPVCSTKKMGVDKDLYEVASACAAKVIVPETNCCGFAGDRGFTYPELNSHGLRELKEQIPGVVVYGYSNSRTCEIGLSLHSGLTFKSIAYLVQRAVAD